MVKLQELFPRLYTVGVYYTINVEVGKHGNIGAVRGGWQDVVHHLCGRKNVLHDMERVTVFSPLCLIVFTVMENVVGETKGVGHACTSQRLVVNGENVVSTRLAAGAGIVDSSHVADGWQR